MFINDFDDIPKDYNDIPEDSNDLGSIDDDENLIDPNDLGTIDDDGDLIDPGDLGPIDDDEDLIDPNDLGPIDDDENLIDPGDLGPIDDDENLIDPNDLGTIDDDEDLIDPNDLGTIDDDEDLIDPNDLGTIDDEDLIDPNDLGTIDEPNDIPKDYNDIREDVLDLNAESFSCEQRRKMNNEILKSKNIVTNDNLLCYYSEYAELKNKDVIIKKSIASLIMIQLGCDICNDKKIDDNTINNIKYLLNNYDVMNFLNEKEKKLLIGNYTKQDAFDVVWEYETVSSIFWALGLSNDLNDPSKVCDFNGLMNTLCSSKSYEDFAKKCNLKSKEEILNMQDLYFRYDWAIQESKINKDMSSSNLNPEVVYERRKGLDWILSNEMDWNSLNIDTISYGGLDNQNFRQK